MKLLNNLSLKGKLTLGFGLIVLGMLIVGILSMVQLANVKDQASGIVTYNISGVRDALSIAESATRYRTREYRLLHTTEADRQKYLDRLPEARDTVAKHAKSYSEFITSDEERAFFKTFQERWAIYLARSDEVRQAVMAGDQAKAVELVLDGSRLFDAVAESTKALAEFNGKQAEEASQTAERVYQSSRTFVIVLLVLAVGTAVALGWLISNAIARPLQRAVNLAQGVAEGDLTHTLAAEGRDEVAQLTRALSAMVDRLRTLVTEVRHGVESVSTASAQIATGNQDLSARTEQTASSLQETASSMEELTGTVSQSADTARQANQLASGAAQAARRGGDVVNQVVANMAQITSSSKKISDIIAVIDGIAFQTNILALNAAVEAARAGEQGRGFAVVAGEVRTLAQRSAQAAKEIKALIGDSVDTVESGARLVGDAGTVMQEIVTSVQRVTDLMGEIAAAASEQRDGIGQVNTAVTHLDQMTQQNAALVEESAAAASSLRDQAHRLSEVVSVFNVGHHGAVAQARGPSSRPAPHAAIRKPVAAQTAPKAVGASRPAAVATGAKPAALPAGKPVASATAREEDWESF
ncbi:MAG: methyl-accepting chemotaxis protein [Pseudomonadota bacterium]